MRSRCAALCWALTLQACSAEPANEAGGGTGGSAANASAGESAAAAVAGNAESAGEGDGASGSGGAGDASGAGGASGSSGSPAGTSATHDASIASDASASDGGDAGHAPECGLCAAYAAPEQTGLIDSPNLDSLSGLASSRKHPGVFFAHNDRIGPVVYAIDRQGALRARISLAGASANDLEDIAVGPCDDASCVFVADIGDNSATRDEYAILRFEEPELRDQSAVVDLGPPFQRFAFRYEDGSHNAEGLMVGPDGSLYIVTKLSASSGGVLPATGRSAVYKLSPPFDESATATAVLVSTLSIPADGDLAASGAAAHPCGLGVLVRTYDRVYELRSPPGAGFEAAFEATPERVSMPNEPQSEGIDYLPDGLGFVTSGEGASAPVVVTGCQ